MSHTYQHNIHLKFTPLHETTPTIWTHREIFYQNNHPHIHNLILRNYGNTEMRISLTTPPNITLTESHQLIDEYIALKSELVQAILSESFSKDIQNSPQNYPAYLNRPNLQYAANPHYTLDILGISSAAA